MVLPARSFKRQRGIALIMALMLAAIAVAIVTAIYVQQRYAIRLTQNLQDLEQAYQYGSAAETMATVWLKRDLKGDQVDLYKAWLKPELQGDQVDSRFDKWAGDLEPFEIDDDNGQAIGNVTIKIEDLQGYFNVNDVYAPKEKKPHPLMMKAFQRLLQSNDVPLSFAFSVLDWVDPDDKISDPDSAESDYYLMQDPEYRTSNEYLVDPSELSLLRLGNIEDAKEKKAALERLAPYIVTLPTPTSINVNTALPEVLEAIGFTNAQAKATIDFAKTAPIKNVADLSSAVPGIDKNALQVLGTSSNYFRLIGQVRFGRSRLFINSILFRSPEGEVHVIMRNFDRPAKKKEKTDTVLN